MQLDSPRLAHAGRLVTGGSVTSPARIIRHRVSFVLVLTACAVLPWLLLGALALLVRWLLW